MAIPPATDRIDVKTTRETLRRIAATAANEQRADMLQLSLIQLEMLELLREIKTPLVTVDDSAPAPSCFHTWTDPDDRGRQKCRNCNMVRLITNDVDTSRIRGTNGYGRGDAGENSVMLFGNTASQTAPLSDSDEPPLDLTGQTRTHPAYQRDPGRSVSLTGITSAQIAPLEPFRRVSKIRQVNSMDDAAREFVIDANGAKFFRDVSNRHDGSFYVGPWQKGDPR